MNKYLLSFLLFFCLSVELSAQDLLPFVENITKANYNGDNQVWSVAQGNDNAMYFANNHFFLRYNGVNWEKYTLPNKTIIRSVFADGDRIYTGSYNELGYWKRVSGTMKYYSLSNKKLFFGESVNEEVWKIFKFKGTIYFQSFNQIFIYNGKNVEKLNLPSQISYCFPIDDLLYVATVNNGIYYLNSKKFTKENNWPILNNSIIHSIDKYNNKTYFFTRKNGVFVEENGVVQPWNSPLNGSLKSELINTARFLSNDRLAIGTAFKGIYIIDMKNNSHVNINRNNALKNNSVLSIGLDKENDLWLGMDNGIVHIEINSPYKNFVDNTGILGTVYSIAPTNSGYLLGTNHGVFKHENKELTFIEGSQGQVWQIDKINDNYIIGHNDGTFLYNGSFQKLNSINGGWKVLKNNYNSSYFQAYYSGVVIYADDNFKNFTKVSQLTKPIRNLAQKNKNELWAVDNYKSLYRIEFDDQLKTKKVVNVTKSNGFKNDFNVKLINFKNEVFFYINNSWYTYNPITSKLELSKQFNEHFKDISGINPIDEESFLVIKDGFFYVIYYKDNQFQWNLIPKKYYDGKSIGEDTKVIKQGNQLVVNLDDGFFVFEMKEKQLDDQKITIEGFYNSKMITDDTSINYNQSVELNVITPYFGYNKANLFYTYNDDDNYLPVENGKIVLNNLDNGWKEVVVYYRNGTNYIKVADYSFNVSKPWYFSFWMVLLYILILGGGLFLYYRWNKIRYIEKIKLKEEELKHQKAIYQLELDAENKLKIQEYEKHILEIQVQTKASEVAGKSLSIAKQTEMIETIQKLLEKENDLSTLKGNIKKAIKLNSINKKEWETFESNLFKSHEDFIKRITTQYSKLSSKDIKLCIYLKMSLSSKEIAPLMNISYRGVELHRYRLRKKIGLNQDVSLSNFINNI
ncbi:histidine kinase [Flavobacterium sp.]|uniref:histidine kinase n=1 Tax=Flavobacterium sp. TaxID=239 RepID=UPI002B4B8561|nr:histidine kinase [Flavobacterium sp.]HLP64589.1 hypothetical protein [Flavobacterium sp.]